MENTNRSANARYQEILDDMVDRGLFPDHQTAFMAAVEALQMKVADDTYTDEYFDEKQQSRMDYLQLKTGT